MRTLLLSTALLVSACSITPEHMAEKSNWDVCRLSTTPASGRVAEQEAARRGLDCRPYYGSIQQQQANENAAVQNYQRAVQPVPRPSTNCTSYRVGNTMQTDCR